MSECRFCGGEAGLTFADLGTSPPSNAFLRAEQLGEPETWYPLHAVVCETCWLVQLPAFHRPAQIFAPDYAYFSSFSSSWVDHARRYAEMAIKRFGLGARTSVVEVASNDGYLLRHFREAGIPVLGIEPARNVAQAAEAAGVRTMVEFFGLDVARRLVDAGEAADLVIGNNVLAHVPDLNDFVAGLACVLKRSGVLTMEFPHLLRLIAGNQFDTIYHEHFSYFSLATAARVFARHGLRVFDVEELSTHGGSLRVFVCPDAGDRSTTPEVAEVLAAERSAGLETAGTYAAFDDRVRKVRRELLRFLLDASDAGRTVAGYGAPAKGNTLLNACGVRGDLIDFTVDISPHKQGLFLPGSRIPVLAPEAIDEARPDYILILPWNLRQEIAAQLAPAVERGARLFVPIPSVQEI